MRQILLFIATFFNIGRLPLAPGTWSSLVTTVLVYFIKPYWQAPLYIQIAAIVIVFVLGIPAASAAEKHLNKKDPNVIHKIKIMKEGRKPLGLLHGEIKTPPFSSVARIETGCLLG